MIKHDINESITASPHRLVLPVSGDSRLNSIIFKELAARYGEAYNLVTEQWRQLDRAAMVDHNGFIFKETLPIVLVPVKKKALQTPKIDLNLVLMKLGYWCRKYGCGEVALSRSTWLAQRYTVEQYLFIVDGLEAEGILVHEYE